MKRQKDCICLLVWGILAVFEWTLSAWKLEVVGRLENKNCKDRLLTLSDEKQLIKLPYLCFLKKERTKESCQF